jgi:hypothetical protein
MAVVVSLLGVLAAAIGLLGVAKPKSLIDLVADWRNPTRFWVAVLFRLILGTVLLVAAPTCRLPAFVRVVGALSIVAASGILVIGPTRLDTFIRWWLERSPAFIRIWAFVAVAFGVLLICAGA